MEEEAGVAAAREAADTRALVAPPRGVFSEAEAEVVLADVDEDVHDGGAGAVELLLEEEAAATGGPVLPLVALEAAAAAALARDPASLSFTLASAS